MAKTTKEFDTLYSQLNKEQKKAVDTVEGPVMVIAGPGTGKTQILTLRIANILVKTDADPENILALTFTEAGAVAMRKRLATIIGPAAYRVTIATFHSFCNEVIQTYPEEFPRIIGARPTTDVDQIGIVQDVIESTASLNLLRPYGDPLYYVRSIKSAIGELKRENIGEDTFAKLVDKQEEEFNNIEDLYHEKGRYEGKMKGKYGKIKKYIDKNKELVRVYRAYQDELTERRLYDYNDMIIEVIRELQENEDLLLALQERFQYVLADEHQDANNAQNTLLELLASYYERPNLFIVGDEKQAIFRFQGASLENFLYFKKRFTDVTLVELTKNYRSTQTILDSSHSLITGAGGESDEVSRPELTAAAREKGAPVTCYTFSSPEVEHFFIAKNIEEQVNEGIPPGEIAVLYRTNNEAFPIADMLEKIGVPFVIESDQSVLSDPRIQKLLRLLYAVRHFGQDEHLVPVLHLDVIGLEPLAVYKLIHGSAGKSSLYEAVKSEGGEFAELYKKLAGWHTFSRNHSLTKTFELIARESGFIAHLLSSNDPYGALEKVSVLFDEVRALAEKNPSATLEDLIDHLEMLKEHDVLVKKRGGTYRTEHVHLMTAHRAKGQEFERVYITNMVDGNWGNRRSFQRFLLPLSEDEPLRAAEDQDDDDERRLFYVAITRAKQDAVVSYARVRTDGREQVPSQFLEEIKEEYIQDEETDPYEEAFEKERDIMFAAPKETDGGVKNKKFIQELFRARGLAVTALNNYLSCPWRYFYVNLLRVPRSLSIHQKYGIAVHRALTLFFQKVKEEHTVPKETLLALFDDSLAAQPLTEQEHEQLRKKGEEALSGYYDTYADSWATNLETPFRIKGVELEDGTVLTGELDKIEFVGQTGQVHVVDYKTGKPKSRNWILGKTRNSDGDYWRQLVFYNLLLNKYADGKYTMVSGEIDFIEPNERGKYKKEEFAPTPEDVQQLTQTITRVVEEINSLAFWDTRCDDDDCEWCQLRDMMEA